jgi:hypothetical protein
LPPLNPAPPDGNTRGEWRDRNSSDEAPDEQGALTERAADHRAGESTESAEHTHCSEESEAHG